MKKIFLTLIFLATAFFGYAQPATNGAINGKSKTGIRHEVGIDSTSPNRFRLGVADSTGNVYLLALKLKADSIYTKIMASIAVTGTFYQATQPVSFTRLKSSTDTITVAGSLTNISGTISLPTGASTAALQTTGNTSLGTIDAGIPAALGQTTMSASMPVTIASNQSAIPISGTVTVLSALQEAVVSERGTDSIYSPGDRSPLMADTNGITWVHIDSLNSSYLEQISTSAVAIQAYTQDNNEVTRGVVSGGTTITTQNITPTNTTTTASFVAYPNIGAHGYASAYISVTGTYTGALSLQVIADDGTNNTWTQVGNTGYRVAFRRITTGVYYDSIPSGQTGIYEINVNGTSGFRITALGAVTGTATVYMTVSPQQGTMNGYQYELLQQHNAQGSTTTGAVGMIGQVATTTSAPSLTNATISHLSGKTNGDLRVNDADANTTLTALNAKFTTGTDIGKLTAHQSVDLTKVGGTSIALGQTTKSASIPVTIGSDDSLKIKYLPSITTTAGATATYDSSWTTSAMTITNLSALASSATVGWQSARVTNLTGKALDYKIGVKVSMANTAPANDKAIYVYAIGWWSSDGGTTWIGSSIGTTTAPTGTEGACTLAQPHNMRLLGVLNYTTADMNPADVFFLSNAFGSNMPDGFSLMILNYSGSAVETTSGANNIVYYTPLNKTQR